MRRRYPELKEEIYRLTFVATKDVYRISTNGKLIYFDPDWLSKLDVFALDYIISHQLMHILLGHINRSKYYRGDRYHLAADIVANACLTDLGWNFDRLSGIGRIYDYTFYPRFYGSAISAEIAFNCVPFDPAALSPGKRRQYMIDSDAWWEAKEDTGDKCVVILTPLEGDPDDVRSDKLPEYEDFKPKYRQKFDLKLAKATSDTSEPADESEQSSPQPDWELNSRDTIESLQSIKRAAEKPDLNTQFTERMWRSREKSNLDWRSLIDCFVQTEINDYSFTPPDRRIQNDFFLPDFNVATEEPRDVLFMVDSSGSISEEMLIAVYSELCAAIDQFNGNLKGSLAFFDTKVYPPKRFEDVVTLSKITPPGGGGTDFNCIFDFIVKRAEAPDSIVIFTDGEGTYPDICRSGTVPILWLLTKSNSAPPWGKYAVIKNK